MPTKQATLTVTKPSEPTEEPKPSVDLSTDVPKLVDAPPTASDVDLAASQAIPTETPSELGPELMAMRFRKELVDEKITGVGARDAIEGEWTNPEGPVVYVWNIPHESEGYTFRLQVKAKSLDEARYLAGETKIGVDDETKFKRARGLNQGELNWIATVEPEVVIETQDITIDYVNALNRNKYLNAENVAFQETKKVFSENAINVYNPREWMDRTHNAATDRIRAADGERLARSKALYEHLGKLGEHIKELQNLTGYTPPPVPVEAEADYSVLTILYPSEEVMNQREYLYPKLMEAGAACREPGTPMDTDEKTGLSILERVVDSYIVGFGPRMTAGDTERAQVEAFMRYVKTRIE